MDKERLETIAGWFVYRLKQELKARRDGHTSKKVKRRKRVNSNQLRFDEAIFRAKDI